MNYIKKFQNVQALSVSVRNSSSEDQLIHTFLDEFHQGGKYSAQIYSHQAELRREEKFTDRKYLSISSLQTDYLNLDSISGFGRNSERENVFHKKWNFCGGTNHSSENVSKGSDRKGNSCAAGESDNRQTELTPRNVLNVDLKIT